ncbi:type I restriction endonuclease subunit R [Nostoc sp. CENA543]|uniref:type I restriction endonuclease n=1 Tax=Nostoc sp. CENA543 TaxID=1869241 RepID=UPI000CA36657|nr:type I restriction endonuclease [Nostoc sp. CENA543]AUT01195.1 type I restriction endonuclease subunit R [Nostoc sp. CENA543]
MMRIATITEAITSLTDVETRFALERVEDEQFFPEWFTELPEINNTEKDALDVLRRRYIYHRGEGNLLEGTVMLLVVSPLLALAGFYDPPFKIKAESSVELIINDGEEVLRGRIDVLVLQNQFWVVVLESKKTTLSVWSAIPQALAYLMVNPHPHQSVFGMVTNGDDVLFIKLQQQDIPQYDLSSVFAPLSSKQEMYTILQILKRIGLQIR